jgi:hypothetical protein
VGLTVTTVLGYALPWSEPWREVGPLTLPLAVALIALLAALQGLIRELGRLPLVPLPEDARAADGAVGIALVANLASEPNTIDPRFRRFVARQGGVPSVLEPQRATPSAPPLLGRIVLISMFMGRDGQPWSEAEIARAHSAMLRAGAWIEREAIRWNAPVNIELADTYFVVNDDLSQDVEIGFALKGEDIQPFETDAVAKALTSASRAATQLGFDDAVALIAEINSRVQADAPVWLLHPRQAGHSLAVPLDDTPLAGVSLAVCYAREENFPEPLEGPPFTDPVTIVHELLHLFGASDKYGVPLRSFAPGSVTNREVMRLDENSLIRLRIDPLTAQEIGWFVGER